MQRSAWCNYQNTLKQHGARQSQQRCWHISARQAGPAGVRGKACHQTTLKYWMRWEKLGSSAGSTNMRRFMVCSSSDCFTGRIQQTRREEQEAKKQENKVNFRRRTWRFLKQNHISLSLFSFKLPRINFFFICYDFASYKRRIYNELTIKFLLYSLLLCLMDLK